MWRGPDGQIIIWQFEFNIVDWFTALFGDGYGW